MKGMSQNNETSSFFTDVSQLENKSGLVSPRFSAHTVIGNISLFRIHVI